MTVEEYAKKHKIDPGKVRRMARSGKIKAEKIPSAREGDKTVPAHWIITDTGEDAVCQKEKKPKTKTENTDSQQEQERETNSQETTQENQNISKVILWTMVLIAVPLALFGLAQKMRDYTSV